MTIELHCPHCDGVARFQSARRRSAGRLIGRCDGCSSTFSLYGGQVSTLERRNEPAMPRWPFATLGRDGAMPASTSERPDLAST